jgi:maltooligosyltrehalose trehalohydrolase
MAQFRVWAPLPQTVEVEIAGTRHAMTRGSDGWWVAEVKSAGVGTDYGFVVDGGRRLPDPRSAWQPHGVHGASRWVDHAAFKWEDDRFRAEPLNRSVVYELHMGAFTPGGTFDAAIGRLEHLVQLGITHVEVMPVNAFPGEHGWGYDGVDLFAPHEAYGGPDGLKRFVNACHAHGLAVLLDVVYNHLGPSGNYLGVFAPYFTERHHTPWGAALNFDGPDSNEVRRFFCDNALMWLRDYHCDGLRLDAVHAIVDTSAQPFLAQLAAEVKQLSIQLDRPLVLIAESDLNDPRLVLPTSRGGFGLDAQWSDDFHHALHTTLTGERAGYYEDFNGLAHLAKALKQAFVYDGCHSRHRGRRHGRSPAGVSGHGFLAYAQNHDQVGNRARGERLSHLVNPGRLKIAAALVLTSPFVPLIFQGEEWAASSPFQYFTDHPEPELARVVREGRCQEFAAFGWKPEEVPDPQARETFERSKLRWDELGNGVHAEMLVWHQQLIHLRRTEPVLEDGALENVILRFDKAAQWLVLERGPLTVACNLARQAQPIELTGTGWSMILRSSPEVEIVGATVRLSADSVALLKRS